MSAPRNNYLSPTLKKRTPPASSTPRSPSTPRWFLKPGFGLDYDDHYGDPYEGRNRAGDVTWEDQTRAKDIAVEGNGKEEDKLDDTNHNGQEFKKCEVH